MAERVSRRSSVALALLLAAVAAAVYAPAVHNGFVWDDDQVVVRDPRARDLRPLGTVVFSADEVRPYYRPLTRASFVVEWAAFGAAPRPFHAISVAFHVVNVVLLFRLVLGLFRHVWPAFAAGLLLAVHPINAEAVNFISGRNNVMGFGSKLSHTAASVKAARTAFMSRPGRRAR